MDGAKLVDNEPGVHVKVFVDDQENDLWLSSIYGSYKKEVTIKIKKDSIAKFYCTHCNKEIPSDRKCTVCDAPMIAFREKRGGSVNICSREGCKKHSIEFEDMNEAVSYFNDAYSYNHVS